jgi:hypothetical protein
LDVVVFVDGDPEGGKKQEAHCVIAILGFVQEFVKEGPVGS